MDRFEDVFPAENVKCHLVGGVYAKEIRIPAGFRLMSHRHHYDHLSILASGIVTVTVDGVARDYSGPTTLTIAAGKNHEVEAVTEAVWFCIHATDVRHVDDVDQTLIMEEV